MDTYYEIELRYPLDSDLSSTLKCYPPCEQLVPDSSFSLCWLSIFMLQIQSKGCAQAVNALRRCCRSKLGVQAELVSFLCLKKRISCLHNNMLCNSIVHPKLFDYH